MSRPLLLLDVDGVLNAFGGDAEDLAAWTEWSAGWATSDGTAWPITFAPEVVARLSSWHEEGRLELQWLTTWGHDANGELRELLGLPHLDVAGTYQDEDDEGAAAASAAVSHAAVAPSAPDPLSGRWWKYDVVRRMLAADPDRLLIWVDDELAVGSAYRSWADAQPRVRAVGPDPAVGLSPAGLDVIAEQLPASDSPADDRCRRCGGQTTRIAYGYPGPEMWEAAERGEVVLGGCVIAPGQPRRRCTACGSGATWERDLEQAEDD